MLQNINEEKEIIMIFKQKCLFKWISFFMLSASLVGNLLATDHDRSTSSQSPASVIMTDCKEYAVKEYVLEYPGCSYLEVKDKTGGRIEIVPYLNLEGACSFDFDGVRIVKEKTNNDNSEWTYNPDLITTSIEPFYLTNSVHLTFSIEDEQLTIKQHWFEQNYTRKDRSRDSITYRIEFASEGTPPKYCA